MAFDDDVAAFNRDTVVGLEISVRATFIEALSAVMRATPVDTGRARSNWFTGVNRTPTVTSTRTRDGSRRLRDGARLARTFRAGGSLTLVNNLPYITKLEDGHSRQAPRGMVKVVFSRLERILYRNIRALR